MCGILVARKSIGLECFEHSFKKIQFRGPDDSRIMTSFEYFFGFQRLAIMGLEASGMQPFEYQHNLLVCNGEIYGYEKIKENLIQKGYTFHSGSDCEVLLPLYQEYGLEMFKFLDAEFVLVLYDHKAKRLIAARDPLGIRPLFYGYAHSDGQICFASEAKALIDFCPVVKPFPIGSYYDGKRFRHYHRIHEVNLYRQDTPQQIDEQINTLLTKAVQKRLVSDRKVGFLLSGGLDSSLVCALGQRICEKPITTFAIGMRKDAIDLKYARIVANHIRSNHHEVIMDERDVIDVVEEVIVALESYDITTIRASIGMYLLCRYIQQKTDIRVLLTGEVSDELFGYKYTDFAPSALAFQQESQKRIRELYQYDVLRADRCISSHSLEARVPFADLDFVRYVLSLDPQKKMNHNKMGKYLLRRAFIGSYLPDEILYREKAAFSDAVGHSMVDLLKAHADTLYSEEDVKQAKVKYPINSPFTKESLWYRDLFEKHYPHHAHLIPAFWMPNKKWPGCKVQDPSARVLSNYGASGR